MRTRRGASTCFPPNRLHTWPVSENISALLAGGTALPPPPRFPSLISKHFFSTCAASPSPSDGIDVVHEPNIMRWSENTPLLHEMSYNNGSLVIQKEGYYYVYSKVSFKDTGVFYHSICRTTQLYTKGMAIPLLTSRKYSDKTSTTQKASSNSYLGGVFHLKVDDNVYVSVSDITKLLLHESYEHIFGAYML